jgi:hypothetical protein
MLKAPTVGRTPRVPQSAPIMFDHNRPNPPAAEGPTDPTRQNERVDTVDVMPTSRPNVHLIRAPLRYVPRREYNARHAGPATDLHRDERAGGRAGA